jgi:hypothetical protein
MNEKPVAAVFQSRSGVLGIFNDEVSAYITTIT